MHPPKSHRRRVVTPSLIVMLEASLWNRFLEWLSRNITWQRVVAAIALCLLLAGVFALGAAFGRRRILQNLSVGQNNPPSLPANDQPRPPLRGTFGAIASIDGDTIQLRDPRSGRTWFVRTGNDTIIEFGPRRRIPLKQLRVGQRVFVVGVANSDSFDARFIGVVLGQQQRYVMPPQPVICTDCSD